jgi:hypothetical protein
MDDYSCKKCKKNNHQKYNACGYIPYSERRKSKHNEIPLYSFDLYPVNYGVDICLYWYLREYGHLRAIFNMSKNTDILNSSFLVRTIYNTVSLYQNLKLQEELRKMKEKGDK